jgi:hypothetical protein
MDLTFIGDAIRKDFTAQQQSPFLASFVITSIQLEYNG